MHMIPLSIVVLSVALYVFGYYRMPFVYGGFILQVTYMVLRGMELGRLPLVGPHDTLFFLSTSFMLFAIPASFSLKNRKRFIDPCDSDDCLFHAIIHACKAPQLSSPACTEDLLV